MGRGRAACDDGGVGMNSCKIRNCLSPDEQPTQGGGRGMREGMGKFRGNRLDNGEWIYFQLFGGTSVTYAYWQNAPIQGERSDTLE